ncbi:MAG: hypothetical protein ACYS3N_00130 [Planctomycetota bacterium]|jgi:hypothetical protein
MSLIKAGIVENSTIYCFIPIKPSPKMCFSHYTTERKEIIDIIPLENQFNSKRVQTIKYDSNEDIETIIRRRYEHSELPGLW